MKDRFVYLRAGRRAHLEADGVLKPVPEGSAAGRLLYSEDHLPVVDAERPVDALLAAQLGAIALLDAMRPRSFDLALWLSAGEVRSRPLEFQRKFMDWPRAEEDGVPCPSVTVAQVGEGTYDQGDLSPDNRIDEDSIDAHCPGTVLKTLAYFTCQLQLLVMTATKDDRAGVRRAFEEALLVEPSDDRPGRRVVVEPYYDQVVRYQLQTMSCPDDGDAAQANQWILVATLAVEVPVVVLVRSPGLMRPNLGAAVTG